MAGSESAVRRRLGDIFDAAGPVGAGWWALDTVKLRHQNGETDVDVLVGIPGSGLLVLEVKSWREFRIDTVGKSKKWSYRSGNGGGQADWVTLERSPYEQSERTQHLLIDTLVSLTRTGALSRGDLPRCESAVVFSSLSNKDLADRLPPIHAPFSFSREDLLLGKWQSDEAKAREALDRLRHIFQLSAHQHARRPDNDAKRLQEVREVLEPSCHVVGLSSLLSDTKDALNHNAELAMSVRAESLANDRVYVEGPAGTGKTVLGLQNAARGPHETLLTALYLCFSMRLAEQIKDVNAVQEAGIVVFTPETLAEHLGLGDMLEALREDERRLLEGDDELRDILGDDGAASREPLRSYLGSERFWLEVITRADEVGLRYSAVVVDEAQDMFEPAFASLAQMVDANGKFVVLCDPRQTTRRERAGKKWEIPLSVRNGARVVLETNLRNPADVISAVERHCDIQYRRLTGNLPTGVVKWLGYNNSTFVNVVRSEIEELENLHVGTVVLHASMSDKQLEQLREADVQSSDVDSNKGLEWDSVVLIVGMERNPLEPNPEDVYVGMTRARAHMTVIHHVSDSLFDGEK